MARRPPVIPEIARAYQNDPRTQLALKMIASGSSGAPVAQGKYAWADGIARALGGYAGGRADRKQQDQYRTDEDQLLALRQQRGVDGLNGMAPAAPPGTVPPPAAPPPPMGGTPAAPVAPPTGPGGVPSAIASILGAPPVADGIQTPPVGSLGLPTAPVPPPMPPGPGGGPGGRRPFVSGAANTPPYLLAPQQEDVPAAPEEVARPIAPEAVGPTQSKELRAAYSIMRDANPYESASGQDLYATGLGTQDKLDEAAAERRQKLIDMGYQTDLGDFADSRSAKRSDTYAERREAKGRNFQAQQTYEGRVFEHGEHKDDQAFQARQNDLNRANAMAVARVREQGSLGGGTALTDEERAAISKAVGDGRLDLKGITKFQAKVVAQALIDNPGLNGIQLHAAATLAANPPAQQKAMLVSAMPDVLKNVQEAGKKLKFSDVQFVGKLQAFTKGQLNDPDFTEYLTQRNDAMQTLAQVMSGVGATDMRTKMEADAAPKTMSPRAWDAWYRGQMGALRPRIQMYERRGLLPPGTTASLTMDDTTPAPAAPTAGWGKMTVH